MITSIELSQIQLQILLGQASGADPDSVSFSLALSTSVDDEGKEEVTATIKTDLKGAQRLERAMAKGSK